MSDLQPNTGDFDPNFDASEAQTENEMAPLIKMRLAGRDDLKGYEPINRFVLKGPDSDAYLIEQNGKVVQLTPGSGETDFTINSKSEVKPWFAIDNFPQNANVVANEPGSVAINANGGSSVTIRRREPSTSATGELVIPVDAHKNLKVKRDSQTGFSFKVEASNP